MATFGGDTAWVVVDVESSTASGPLTDAEVASRPGVARLTTYRAIRRGSVYADRRCVQPSLLTPLLTMNARR